MSFSFDILTQQDDLDYIRFQKNLFSYQEILIKKTNNRKVCSNMMTSIFSSVDPPCGERCNRTTPK